MVGRLSIIRRILFATALLAGCVRYVEPTEPSDSYPVAMPSWALAGFEYVQQCVGRSSRVPLTDMRVFIAPGVAFLDANKTQARAELIDNKIYIAETWAGIRRIWLHEMAHLMYHVTDHPADIFQKCYLIELPNTADISFPGAPAQ